MNDHLVPFLLIGGMFASVALGAWWIVRSVTSAHRKAWESYALARSLSFTPGAGFGTARRMPRTHLLASVCGR